MGPRGFYAILDVRADARTPLPRAEALLAGRPCCLQLRAKTLSAADFVALARAVLPLARAAGVPFCVNDRLDVALAVDADVIHVGQEDLPLPDVRAVLAARGRRMTVGVSTHNLAQARAAAAGGADYIGFGPVFATSTKDRPDPVVGVTLLAEVVRAVNVPVVAIGGITRARLPAVVNAGAQAAAVISDIDSAPNPADAARAVSAAFSSSAHA
jgi:thiamine-phosphate pyrophosphorylase